MQIRNKEVKVSAALRPGHSLSLVVEDNSFLQSRHMSRCSPHPISDVGGKDSAHRMPLLLLLLLHQRGKWELHYSCYLLDVREKPKLS